MKWLKKWNVLSWQQAHLWHGTGASFHESIIYEIPDKSSPWIRIRNIRWKSWSYPILYWNMHIWVGLTKSCNFKNVFSFQLKSGIQDQYGKRSPLKIVPSSQSSTSKSITHHFIILPYIFSWKQCWFPILSQIMRVTHSLLYTSNDITLSPSANNKLHVGSKL